MTRVEFRGETIETCERPIFLVGAPRSSTSAFAYALASHSELWTSGESFVFFDLFAQGKLERAWTNASGRPSSSLIAMEGVSRADFFELAGLGLNVAFTRAAGGKRWIDHTPHYSLMLDQLGEIFPAAQVLHLVRDGRRVVHSMLHFMDQFDEERRETIVSGGFVPPWAVDFGAACRTWRDYVCAGAGWIERHPGRGIDVRLSALTADPAAEFLRIHEFLGVEDEEAPAWHFSRVRLNSSFGKAAPGEQPPAAPSSPWERWTVDQRLTFLELAHDALPWLDDEEPHLLDVAGDRAATAAAIARTVAAAAPAGPCAVVGDSLPLEGREVWPLASSNGDTAAAVEALLRRGARALVVPSWSYVALEQGPLRQYLAETHERVSADETCVLYRLRPLEDAA